LQLLTAYFLAINTNFLSLGIDPRSQLGTGTTIDLDAALGDQRFAVATAPQPRGRQHTLQPNQMRFGRIGWGIFAGAFLHDFIQFEILCLDIILLPLAD
jgi:hypothetical protein